MSAVLAQTACLGAGDALLSIKRLVHGYTLEWNETHIVAAVEKSGWRIVDARNGSISKALSSDEVAIEIATDPELKSIAIYDVAEAWRRLSYW